MAKSKISGSAAGNAAAAAAGLFLVGKDLYDGITDAKDFCLNPAEAAANARDNFLVSFGNMFGGMGDAIMAASGQKTPLQKIQDDTKKYNMEYTNTFDSLTQKFDSLVTQTEGAEFEAMKDLKKYNAANLAFIEEELKEEIDMNTTYIIFLMVLFFIIYFYISIS